LLQTERRDVLVIVVYSIAIGLLSLAVPVAAQSLVNTIAFGSVLQPLVVLSTIVFAALTVAGGLQLMRAWGVEMVQRRIFVRLAGQVADRLLRVRVEAFDRQHGPELVNRFFDVSTVQKNLADLLVDGLSVMMQALVGFVLLAAYHPYLLAFGIVLAFAISIVVFGLGRGAVRTAIAESHAKYAVAGWLEEMAAHRTALRSSSGQVYALTRTNGLLEHYLHDRHANFRILWRQLAGSLFLQAVSLSTLLGVGGWLVMRGELTLGQLIAAELVVGMIVTGLVKFYKSLESFYDLQAAVEKVAYLTDLPTERRSGVAAVHGGTPAALKLEQVSFGYEHTGPVFREVNLTISPGEVIGIHGSSGVGKSSILDVLFALRAPASGALDLDGMDYRELRLSDIRSQIALVRELDVFTGTVLENVQLGSDVSVADVRRALDDVGLLPVITALPEGLETVLATGGRPLSPSQARRLTIARVLVSKPRVLLIDEALDDIDDLQLRGKLCTTLFTPNRPWTVVLATERPELWPLCDRVFSFREGKLVEETLANSTSTIPSRRGIQST
jgi:ABC-type bacteriocin/lantibiotic exporter with double-glycine peptidase domain